MLNTVLMNLSKASPCSPDQWEKLGVVFGGEAPWEGRCVQNFQSTAEPFADGRWRIWYSSVNDRTPPFNIAVAEGIPGENWVHTPAVLTAGDPVEAPLSVGNLPEHWQPAQAVHLRLQNGKHRIYFWTHGPGVVRFLAAESADGCKYRVLDPYRPCLYHPMDRAVNQVHVPAGLIAFKGKSVSPSHESRAPDELVCNDATSVYQLSDGSFELYTVHLMVVGRDDPRYIAHDNAPGCVRIIKRYQSGDGLRWESPRMVLEPDSSDPSDMQFYHLTVTHTDRGRVGLLGHYRVEAQTMDLEWCCSQDGIRWQRPKRFAWLQRGPSDSPDSWGIYPPNRMVFAQDRWWLFYTGVNYSHNSVRSNGIPRSVIMHAQCKDIWDHS